MPPINSLYEAAFAAQKLAFAPVSFMVCLCMQRMRVWDVLLENLAQGSTPDEVAATCDISPYAAKVLLESSLAIESVRLEAGRYYITKLGHVLAKDRMTQVNFDFIFDVCFKGLGHLEEALRTGTPAGLKELGSWATIYEGLSTLPDRARSSWFAFDHFYSDSAFKAALPLVFETKVSSLLDVGGNTGRFTREALQYDAAVRVTIADLPSRVALAQNEFKLFPLNERVSFYPVDLLSLDSRLPTHFDVVWMSQFLVCFSEEQVLRILQKARAALSSAGRLLILDTFWDLQPDPASAFGVIQTTPYFTALANGNSKMYDSATILRLATDAGLIHRKTKSGLGLAHSLAEFSRD